MSLHAGYDGAIPVAIVGAGPVGLSLANGLARHGVRSVLLERKDSTSQTSKAPGLHVRTREIFRQWGIEERFLVAGELMQTITLHSVVPGRHPLMVMDFTELDEEADRPGLLILEQDRIEKILLDTVRESGMCEALFRAEAVALEQAANRVKLTIRQNGAMRPLDAAFVVGCDGASSFVRDALRLPFEGITYSLRPLLADVRLEDERNNLPSPRAWNGSDAYAFAVRLPAGLWRIVCLDRGEPAKSDEVPDREVIDRVSVLLGPGPAKVAWSSRFRIHLRSSPKFRVGRVLLAGDAAHVHSPASGFGMNGGIHDAHNLAWKIAAILRGGDMDRLLDSYEVERRNIIVERVSRYTDLLTRFFIDAPQFFRQVAFACMRLALRLPGPRKKSLRRTTMIDLDYTESPLLNPRERSAGVRLPNPKLFSPDGAEVRLYELLPAGPVILDMAHDRDIADELRVEKVIRIGPAGYEDTSGLIRGLLGGKEGWILVRPDAHVAWAREHLNGIDHATRHALGAKI